MKNDGRFVAKHGHAHPGDITYSSWFSMKVRCSKPSHKSYARYGGRGIRVCDEWNDFAAFLRDMGERPEGRSLGRIDNDGPYAPWNCRWESMSEQQNNRRSNRVLEAFGKKQNLNQWADEVGIKADTISKRMDRWGWSVEAALSTPVRGRTRWHESVDIGRLIPDDAQFTARAGFVSVSHVTRSM